MLYIPICYRLYIYDIYQYMVYSLGHYRLIPPKTSGRHEVGHGRRAATARRSTAGRGVFSRDDG